MSDINCTIMELHCLERAKLEPLNRGKWIAQAERWYALERAQNAWRFQSKHHAGANGNIAECE